MAWLSSLSQISNLARPSYQPSGAKSRLGGDFRDKYPDQSKRPTERRSTRGYGEVGYVRAVGRYLVWGVRACPCLCCPWPDHVPPHPTAGDISTPRIHPTLYTYSPLLTHPQPGLFLCPPHHTVVHTDIWLYYTTNHLSSILHLTCPDGLIGQVGSTEQGRERRMKYLRNGH